MQQTSILGFVRKAKPSQHYGSRSDQTSAHRSRNSLHRPQRKPDRRRNASLKLVADETKAELPKILGQLPTFDATAATVHGLAELAPLDPKHCPRCVLPAHDNDAGETGARIKVWDMDSFDAAIRLHPTYTATIHLNSTKDDSVAGDNASSTTSHATLAATAPVAVLNLASERHAGGGWQNGALAQEEALCYRSSLYLSLHKKFYPLPSLSGIHSPSVLIIRDALSRGHDLLLPSLPSPSSLPVVSVISIAALRKPALSPDNLHFKSEGQRAETKRKIRLTLRIAAHKGHRHLVLGALGCGVFANPPREVARCFLEVMREPEFVGGWWQEVCFAVLDNAQPGQGGKDGNGNFGLFYRELHGEVV